MAGFAPASGAARARSGGRGLAYKFQRTFIYYYTFQQQQSQWRRQQINHDLLLRLKFYFALRIQSKLLNVSQLSSILLHVYSGTEWAFFLAHCLQLKAQGVSDYLISTEYPFQSAASTYFFIYHSLTFVLSTTIMGMPFFMASTVRQRFFLWYSGIILASQTQLPLTMKKSSVEQTTPALPAIFFAAVDLPDPGSPLMRTSFFYRSIIIIRIRIFFDQLIELIFQIMAVNNRKRRSNNYVPEYKRDQTKQQCFVQADIPEMRSRLFVGNLLLQFGNGILVLRDHTFVLEYAPLETLDALLDGGSTLGLFRADNHLYILSSDFGLVIPSAVCRPPLDLKLVHIILINKCNLHIQFDPDLAHPPIVNFALRRCHLVVVGVVGLDFKVDPGACIVDQIKLVVVDVLVVGTLVLELQDFCGDLEQVWPVVLELLNFGVSGQELACSVAHQASLPVHSSLLGPLFIIITISSMKQTISTKNYNAIIEIPYEKLASRGCPQVRVPQCREQKLERTIVIPTCGLNCQAQSTTTQNVVTLQMLEELELAFNTDIRAKDAEIDRMATKIAEAERKLTDNKNQRQNQKEKNAKELLRINAAVDSQEAQIRRLKTQIEVLSAEKQQIAKSKIAQFQTASLQLHKQEQQKLINLNLQAQRRMEAQIANIQATHMQQLEALNIKIREAEILSNQMKAQYSSEKANLLIEIKQLQSRLQTQRKQLETSKVGEQVSKIRIGQLTNTLNSLRNQTQFLKKQIEGGRSRQRDSTRTVENLNKQLDENKRAYRNLDEKNQKLVLELESTALKLNQVTIEYNRTNELYQILGKQNQQLELLISRKDEQIAGLSVPKTYEVKIEKVIDRTQYIKQLEERIESLRRNTLALNKKISDLQAQLDDKDKQLKARSAKVSDLEISIKILNSYIEQKEKSFAWIVQREIARDIEINRGETNKAYKVYPMSEKTYIDFKQSTPRQQTYKQQQEIYVRQGSGTHTVTVQEITTTEVKHQEEELVFQ